jgi:amidohydrolase
LWNDEPLGWMSVSPGPVMAAAETFNIRITGKGGHAALPNQAVDPVLAAAHVITALQSIVARNVDPVETAVVSATNLHGGSSFNIIPPYVDIEGTIRTFKKDVRETVVRRFEEIVHGVAEAMGCQAESNIHHYTPAVDNDPALTERVQRVAAQLFPDADLVKDFQTMGSEDMALMMDDIPGCYFMLGSANDKKGLNAKHHHPKFDFDEQVLPRAAALMVAAAIEMLKG